MATSVFRRQLLLCCRYSKANSRHLAKYSIPTKALTPAAVVGATVTCALTWKFWQSGRQTAEILPVVSAKSEVCIISSYLEAVWPTVRGVVDEECCRNNKCKLIQHYSKMFWCEFDDVWSLNRSCGRGYLWPSFDMLKMSETRTESGTTIWLLQQFLIHCVVNVDVFVLLIDHQDRDFLGLLVTAVSNYHLG